MKSEEKLGRKLGCFELEAGGCRRCEAVDDKKGQGSRGIKAGFIVVDDAD